MISYRDSVVEISEQGLLHNLEQYKNNLHKNQGIILVLKANAYGAGCIRVAELFESESSIQYYAVANIDEGLELRFSGIKKPIMVLNMDIDLFDQAHEFNLEPVLINMHCAQTLIKTLDGTTTKIKAHINFDTGMHRVGFKANELDELCALLQEYKNIEIGSIFSHYVGSGGPAFDGYSLEQLKELKAIATKFNKQLNTNALVHMANTAAAERFSNENLDLQRIGIGLYGISDFNLSLENVFTWKTKVAHIQVIEAGETVSYNRTWTAKRTSKIVTVFVGYADGLNRRLSNEKWSLKWNGKELPIVGDICMDLCMLDATGIDINLGDELTIINSTKDIKKMASILDTISYEIITSISARINRIYT